MTTSSHAAHRAVLWIAGLTVVLHGINLLATVHCTAATGNPAYYMYDTESYVKCADAVSQGVPLSPVFRERVLLPWLIAGARSLGLPGWWVLWITVFLHGPTVLALAALTRRLTGQPWAPASAAALYAVFPNIYQYTPLLGTDVLNVQFMVIGTACALAWADEDRPVWFFAAVGAWVLAQLVRPTFFVIGFMLPALLLPAIFDRRRWSKSAAMIALTFVAPAMFTCLNYRDYGVAAPSMNEAEILNRVIVPKIRAEMRNAEVPGSMTRYWTEERDGRAMRDPDWLAMRLYETGPHDREDFIKHNKALLARCHAFVDAHSEWIYRTGFGPIYHQIISPPRYTALGTADASSFIEGRLLPRAQKLFTLLFLVGFIASLGRNPRECAFVLGVTVVTYLPMLFFMWLFTSARLPVDILAIPFAVVAVSRLATWGVAILIVCVGYLPIRLFGADESWLTGTAGVVLGVYAAVVLARAVPAWWTIVRGWYSRGRTPVVS